MEIKEDGTYIAALRCEDMSNPYTPGVIKKDCMKCGKAVWISKSSQKQKVDGYLCTRCMKDVENESIEDVMYAVTEEIIDEFLDYMIGTGRL